MTVTMNEGVSAISNCVDDFTVEDELYSDLSVEPDNLVLASHRSKSGEVPLVWARTYGPHRARVVYDALGHDTATYDSAGHRELLERCVHWLVGPNRLQRRT